MFKLAKIVTKITEVVHWVGAALMAASAGCCAFAPQWLGYFIWIDLTGDKAELSIYGWGVAVAVSDGNIDKTTFCLFALGAVIVFVLMALVFRNLYLIIKKSEGTTPFQAENVRRLERMGAFAISIPMVSVCLGILLSGLRPLEVHSSGDGFLMGILVLCLTQVFAHGVELEKEVDGLL